jgi:WD40 repeat protein
MTEQLRSQQALRRVNDLQARTGVTLASADGNWLFRRVSSGFEVINTHNAKVRLALPSLPTISASAFSPDGHFFAAAFDNGAVNYWDIRADNPTERSLSNLDITRQLTFSPSSRLLAAAGDFQLVAWDVTSDRQIFKLTLGNKILYLRFENDDALQFTDVEGLERTVNARTGEIVAETTKTTPVIVPPTGSVAYKVCVGEFPRNCPQSDVYLPCGASVADWANARCSTFSINPLSTRDGNRCGYSHLQVLCNAR